MNTPGPTSFYEIHEPQTVRRLGDRFGLHFTPKHGSWLNGVEIEASVLIRQCLDRHIPKLIYVQAEGKARDDERKTKVVKGNWCFITADARTKLKHLYPENQL
ncbi:MAG: hypothetical protein A2Z14_16755 [Chloroflexi bacterium RBG_16_48_8]|nr:MAG: hypothetical protein A2Z14_16755 [Chloroflexi bacterium RBG_16_48_8]